MPGCVLGRLLSIRCAPHRSTPAFVEFARLYRGRHQRRDSPLAKWRGLATSASTGTLPATRFASPCCVCFVLHFASLDISTDTTCIGCSARRLAWFLVVAGMPVFSHYFPISQHAMCVAIPTCRRRERGVSANDRRARHYNRRPVCELGMVGLIGVTQGWDGYL